MSRSITELLEFDRVLEMLADRCHYSVSGERALELGPVSDTDQVRYLLGVTREAVDLLTDHIDFTVGGVRDVRDAVDAADRGALLIPEDLRDILDTLQATRNCRRSFLQINQREQPFTRLEEFIEQVHEFPDLETKLGRTVGSQGEILDSASPELSRIRSQIKTSHRRLLQRLQRMVEDGRISPALQEPIVTMRQGRYVIPVRADRKSQVPGVVQGTSSSGQTMFVEPMDVVELNNAWRQLQMEEEHEIERILRALSNAIGDEAERIGQSINAITALDIALAKARLSFDLRAVEPVLQRDGEPLPGGHPGHLIRLRQARHPLIEPDEVVPIDVDIGHRARMLILTGPNTGGKTVALKTVGLLTLMTQAGLFIPARDGSRMSVFGGVYADIGDEQSIEQSLSTFSSHITRIIAMLERADEDSLVLLDEIGAGTDPEEGSALARAIIDALLDRGCLGLVTTHYSELKSYAYVTPGTDNASVEFDIETLQPTYRLLVGVAGQSNALDIAARLGMPHEIIQDARNLIEPESQEADQMLDEIRHRLSAAELAEQEAAREREASRKARREAEEARREAEEARHLARQEARSEVQAELDAARKLIRRLENAATRPAPPKQQPQQQPQNQTKDGESNENGRRRRRRQGKPETPETAREQVKQVEEQLRTKRRQQKAPARRDEPIRIGDRVDVPSLGMTGEVLGFDDSGDQAELLVGSFKVFQPVALLKRKSGPIPKEASRATIKVPAPPIVENEIHFRGMRADDVMRQLEEYLDDAAQASLPWVRIVHGKGSGILRGIVHDILKSHPTVSRFHLAEMREGGDGVTIAYFKD
jgi:DNA mismatch repair protein MutS2